VDRRSYLMFIMSIMCQPLFKIDDKVVACVASSVREYVFYVFFQISKKNMTFYVFFEMTYQKVVKSL